MQDAVAILELLLAKTGQGPGVSAEAGLAHWEA
jgi:hypothetical protein